MFVLCRLYESIKPVYLLGTKNVVKYDKSQFHTRIIIDLEITWVRLYHNIIKVTCSPSDMHFKE